MEDIFGWLWGNASLFAGMVGRRMVFLEQGWGEGQENVRGGWIDTVLE